MDSYDVRFWPLADGFLTGLKDAVRDRRPFNPRTALPDAETLYYAALRPSEAVMLRESDLHLPKKGWGGSTSPPRRHGQAPPGPTTAPPGRNAA